MPFIIVFNIVVAGLAGIILILILGASIALKDAKRKPKEKAESVQDKIEKVRVIAYLIFFGLLILMIIVNLIF